MSNRGLTPGSKVADQRGVDSTKENFFGGYLQSSNNSYDPYVSGYSFIIWLKVPTWLRGAESDKDANVFKHLSQKNFKSFSGHSNIELETEGIKMGFTQNETHYTKGIGAKPGEFTLKYQEHSGRPLTAFYNNWVSGIRDPKTGTATYPKQIGKPYHSKHHTATLLYVTTRPDADNYDQNPIEFASLWTHVQPKRINIEQYNYDQGDHSFFDLDQTFTGYMNIGRAVEELAVEIYNNKSTYNFYNESDFADLDIYKPFSPKGA